MADQDLPQPQTTPDERFAALEERFGADLIEARVGERGPDFLVEPERLPEFVAALREDFLAEPHLFVDACGVEREVFLEVVYRFSLVGRSEIVTVRAQTPKENPVVASLSGLYPGALWPEREYAEMYGITVTGHPDLRHLLLPEGWAGFPLRKDYRYPLEHPYLAPDPLREDPIQALGHRPEAETETTTA